MLREAKKLANPLEDFHVAPISLTFAALVDHLNLAQRNVVVADGTTLKFNSTYICAEELGAFLHKYDNEMIKGLTAFYDPDPYKHERRGNEIRIEIKSPQVNLIAAVTPQDLLKLMPDVAWGQGFTSRIIMIFSDERIIGDDFAKYTTNTQDLTHDLSIINNLYGQFHVTQDYVDCINNWKQLGEPPVPNHPKLIHYIARRRVHLYKLSMVSSVDRGNALALTAEDFYTAIGWLAEAEGQMPEIFKAGATNVDGQAIDEIHHFVLAADQGQGVSEQRIVHFARERVPIHSILRIIEIMEMSGQLKCIGTDRRSKVRYFSAVRPN